MNADIKNEFQTYNIQPRSKAKFPMSCINCTAIKQTKQDELKTFADLIYDNMNGKTVYAPFQSAVTAMKEGAEIFQPALIKSKGKATEAINAKNAAKEELFSLLIRIAKLMDAEWTTDAQDKLKTDAGYTLNKKPERQNEPVTFVLPPANLKVYNDQRRNIMIVEWEKAENAVTTAFELQLDGGAWQNGIYNEGKRMELNLPFGSKLVVRAKTIGPNSLKSDSVQSEEVMVS